MTSAPLEALEVASFGVREVARSDSTRWTGGLLELNIDGLEASWADQPGLLGVRVHIVRPGESVRVVNALDAVEPAARVEDPDSTFPGLLGRVTRAGVGRSHRLEGLAVIPAADLGRHPETEGYPDSIIDMGGPAAEMTPWSRTTNVVVVFELDPQAPFGEADRSMRRVTFRLARDLAATTFERIPDHVDSMELPPVREGLPSACVIMQIAAEGAGEDTYVYGAPAQGMVPTLLDAREVLDGAITNAAYDHAGVRNPTYFYQRNALVRQLLAAHGSRLRFAGVILTLGYLNGAFEKDRMSMMAAKLARQIGADGAILTTFSGGNSHTDTMLTCRACERLGIRTTVIVAETNWGLTDHVPEADCIVSVGNEDELIEGWEPEAVVGGEDAVGSKPVRTGAYLGAASQMGDMQLTGVAG